MSGTISVIVPVYNTPEKFLCDCVESLLSQSYKDCEILLIDDGSEADTHNLCDALARQDKRVIALHQENKGPSIARNLGLKHVTGEYLTFVDSDDTLLPEAWQTVIAEMEEKNADCAVFGWIGNASGQASPQSVSKDSVACCSAKEAMAQVASDNFACGGGYPWNKMWRVKPIRAINNGDLPLFDESLFTYEDKDWILRTLMGLGNVILLPQQFYDYRYVPSSLTNSAESWCRRQYNAYEAYDKIIEFLKPIDENSYRGAVNFYFDFCSTDLYNQYRHPSWCGGLVRCRRTKKSMYQLCKKISIHDLNGRKRKCLWLFFRTWGAI